MSDQEQDVLMGRFVREHSDAKRKLVAMQTQLERYEKGFTTLANALGRNDRDDFNLLVAKRHIDELPLSEFNLAALVAFLEEYTELRKTVSAGKARLRALGIDAV